MPDYNQRIQDILDQHGEVIRGLRESRTASDIAVEGLGDAMNSLRVTLDAIHAANHAQGIAIDAVVAANQAALQLLREMNS